MSMFCQIKKRERKQAIINLKKEPKCFFSKARCKHPNTIVKVYDINDKLQEKFTIDFWKKVWTIHKTFSCINLKVIKHRKDRQSKIKVLFNGSYVKRSDLILKNL